jgi:pSer/pThr/pTyr-binding forkhead associated (FHA) protein
MSTPTSVAVPRARTAAEVQRVLGAERAGCPFLLLRDGADELHIASLETRRDMLTIGRHPSCDLSIAWDGRVSRTHAVLERLARAWTVTDDGISRNGTYLNTSRLTSRRRLVDGDALRVGETLILFRDPTGATIGATNTAEPVVAPVVTPAQRNVLVALCRPMLEAGEGYAPPASNAKIAAELVLSVDAVKTHMRSLFDRFDIGALPQNQKRAKVAELTLRAGLVTERDL